MKKILKNILIFISYFIYNLMFKGILSLFNINYYSFNTNQRIIYTIVSTFIYILILIFVYRKELKEEIIDFKNNFKKYLPKSIAIYLIGVLLMGLINLLLKIYFRFF